jgi:hypothetical protein
VLRADGVVDRLGVDGFHDNLAEAIGVGRLQFEDSDSE